MLTAGPRHNDRPGPRACLKSAICISGTVVRTTPDRDVALSSYSKGMRQKILLSAALIHNPDLILLDEPNPAEIASLTLS